jgi:hypothetical protein
MGWSFHHYRPVLLQVEVAHGIDYVGVWRWYLRRAIHPVLPDRKHVVPGTELSLGTVTQSDHVQRWQRHHVRLNGALIHELLVQTLSISGRGPATTEEIADIARHVDLRSVECIMQSICTSRSQPPKIRDIW